VGLPGGPGAHSLGENSPDNCLVKVNSTFTCRGGNGIPVTGIIDIPLTFAPSSTEGVFLLNHELIPRMRE
jgi:hypothetical protein